MGRAKNILIGVGVLFASFSYWLHCPVPDGYSASSTTTLRAVLALIKFTNFLSEASFALGFGSSCAANKRLITNILKGPFGIPGTDDDVKERDVLFDGVPVRIYEPARRTGDVLPGFLLFHGGGWTIGDVDTTTDIARRLCKETNAVVVSVEYRLAPEHLFPAAFDDSVTASKYFIKNAERFDVDPTRVAVGGESAGGNLATAVCLKLRDEDFRPEIKLQVLLEPVVQGLDFQLPSYVMNADGPLLTAQEMAYFVLMYLVGSDAQVDLLLNNGHISPAVKKAGLPFIDVNKLPGKYLVDYVRPDSVESGNDTFWNEMKDKLLDPYFAPLMAPRLDGLPPAYVFTAEHDPLRDEGILYAGRLEEAGVKVKHRHSDIAIHVMMGLAKVLPEADEVFREMTSFIAGYL